MASGVVYQGAYVGLFGLTAVACAAGLTRFRRIEDADTRRGLGALLLLSALWAVAQAGYVLAPDQWTATGSYTAGLVVGLATVGAWLYFCSAYTGRTYHRKPLYRRLALGVYLALVALKLTNQWHGLYFETTTVLDPFRHTAVQEKSLYWIVAGFSYVLSAVGFSLLVDVFEESQSASKGLKVVFALAALPVALDLLGYLSPAPILGLNYESVGVGVFALGALYVVREPFLAVSRYGRVQLVDTIDDAVLILDTDDRVRDYNDAALDLFPELAGRDAPPLGVVVNEVDTSVLADGGTVELERDGETRYFVVRTTPLTVGATEIGRGVVWSDVTEIERRRRDLRRKDEQLEGFARAITHELRNSVGILSGQAELLSRSAADADSPDVQRRVETIAEETEDLERIVEELRTLARYSQTISERSLVDLGDVARSAKQRADVDELDLDVERSVVVEADRERLRELFQQAFGFSVRNDASRVALRGREGGFTVEDDGQSLAEFDEDDVFEYGNAVPSPDTAMFLPSVRMLATTHGWEVSIDSDYTEGAKMTIDGVETGDQPR